jgi:Ca2+-binding EF-hand superfamily protein
MSQQVESTLATLLFRDRNVPAAMHHRSHSESTLKKAPGRKRPVFANADINQLADVKPWMSRHPLSTLESSSKTSNDDQMFLAQLSLQRRSSSTSALQKGAGRKKPVIDISTWDSSATKSTELIKNVQSASDREVHSLLSRTQDSFFPGPPSTPPLPTNPTRRVSHSDQHDKSSLDQKGKLGNFRSTIGFEKRNIRMLAGRPCNTFEIDDPFMENLDSTPKHERGLSSMHATEHVSSSSTEAFRRSGIKKGIAATPGAQQKATSLRGSIPGFKQRRGEQKRGSRGSCEVSIELNCPLDTTMDAQCLFKQFANNGDLDEESFGKVVEKILKSTNQQLSGESLKKKIQASWKEADRNENGKVSFDEFAIWYSSWGFQQVLLLSPQKIRARDFAKKYDLSIPEVDAVYTKFQHFDEDRSGLIEFPEFVKLLHKLLRVPKGAELPANRLNHFWKEIDIDGSGTVCMDEFLQWYAKYFDVKGHSSVSPIEHFYQSLRPTGINYTKA